MPGGRTDGQRDRRKRPKTTELYRSEQAEVGLDTPGRIGAYGQRRSRPRDTSEGSGDG